MAKVDAKYAPLERDLSYWIEHVVHWHLVLLGVALIMIFSYLLLDPQAPALASILP